MITIKKVALSAALLAFAAGGIATATTASAQEAAPEKARQGYTQGEYPAATGDLTIEQALALFGALNQDGGAGLGG